MTAAGGAGAVTLYLSKDKLDAWFAKAAPGAKYVYATGPAVDNREGAAALAREWAETGEAELFKVRDPETRQLLHCVRRLRPSQRDSASGEAARGQRVSADEAFRETPEGRLYLMLVRSANLQRTCPSNAELAQFAGLKNADQARYVLHEKLVKPGLIEVRHEGAGNAQRRVKIVETGRWTASFDNSLSKEMLA